MRTKAQIKEFIEINHHLMSIQEMADELGVPYKNVHGTCKYHGWEPAPEINRIQGKQVAPKQIKPMTSDMIPGLKNVCAEMMEGATDEEKKKFYEMCMTEKVKL
jgi:hypothetical protein